jgi:hypothetical protein
MGLAGVSAQLAAVQVGEVPAERRVQRVDGQHRAERVLVRHLLPVAERAPHRHRAAVAERRLSVAALAPVQHRRLQLGQVQPVQAEDALALHRQLEDHLQVVARVDRRLDLVQVVHGKGRWKLLHVAAPSLNFSVCLPKLDNKKCRFNNYAMQQEKSL